MCSSWPRSLLRWQIEPFLNLDLDYLALNIDVTSDTLNIHNVGAMCNYRKERRGEMEVYEKNGCIPIADVTACLPGPRLDFDYAAGAEVYSER